MNIALLRRLIRAIRAHPQRTFCIGGRGSAFCSGLDLREIRRRRTARLHLDLLIELHKAIAKHAAPIVALIHGPARGGGVGLACCGDLAIASDIADFAIPWMPGYRPLARVLLPLIAARRRINRRAFPLGERMGAASAHKLGLIDAVVAGTLPASRTLRLMLNERISRHGERIPHSIDRSVFSEMRRLARRASTAQARGALLNYLNRRIAEKS